ncbi:MAG: ATP-dependent RecD-like DNA helicase [Lachnospiraceae bacterium]|nr:ATP-dependent RecD-like DNA helicase [Lachnospiraceae bacterium]
MQTIEVYVERVIFQNEENGYCVLMTRLDDEEIIVVGTFYGDMQGQMLRVTGETDYHQSYGEQFKVQEYEVIEPSDEESVRRYLSSGAVKGIGEALAGRIIKKFGRDTLRIMEEEPERLAEIKGISMRKAQEISVSFSEKRDLRSAMLFLQKYGITNKLAVKIYETYGLKMYGILNENPYKLSEDIEGVGFKTADMIAEKIGIHTDSDYRIRSGLLYVLSQALADGNMYLPRGELLAQAQQLLEVQAEHMEPHIMNLAIDKKVVIKQEHIYSARAYHTEVKTAGMLVCLSACRQHAPEEMLEKRISAIEKEEQVSLDELQREAVRQSVKNSVFVLTGGPGTGKTTTINVIIKYFLQQGLHVALAAPTGRAAKRMTEATGYEAQTIHRLLEVGGDMEGRGGYFERDEFYPLEQDVIIIDEMSMVDIFLFQALLAAIPEGARLILVGDTHQLPSVGPGQVLGDIVDSGAFACIRLEKIFRQEKGSDIVYNAHKIKSGTQISLDNQSKDFFFLPRNDTNRIYNNIVQLVTDKMPRYVDAQPYDIQVLTPMKKGPLGVAALNHILQEYINPQDGRKKEYAFGERIFREGDKVMQIKNNYKLEWEIVGKYNITIEKGCGVFNGDVGKITSINEYARQVSVEYEEGKTVVYAFDAMDELELAYAMTIHKSQGSEYPAVIIPVLGVPRLLLYRNLLYTAVTRAVRCVTIIGSEELVAEMIKNENVQTRYSGLREKICENTRVTDE